MSMHLVGPWMTTTSTRKRKSKKTKRQLQADIEHDKWLRKMGAHPSQRGLAQSGRAGALGASGRWFNSSIPDQSLRSDQIPLSNRIVPIQTNKSVDRETKLMYSSQYVVGQAYNKGGLQVLSKEDANDPTTGKRRG